MKRNLIIILSIISIIAIVTILRVANLGGPSFAADENYQFFAAKGLLEEGKPILPSGLNYDRAYLFSRLVSFSLSLFGVNETAARLPSVLFGLLTVLLVFYWGKKYFNLKVGLITALLIGFSPVEIAWSRECRMYAAFQFFYLLGVFSFFNGFEKSLKDPTSTNKIDLTESFTTIYQEYGLSLKQILWLIVSLVSFIISFKLHRLTGTFYFSIIVYFLLMFLLLVYSKNIKIAIRSKYFFSFFLILLITIFAIFLFPNLFSSAKNMFQYMPAWARMRNTSILYYYNYFFSFDFFPLGALFLIGSFQTLTRFHKTGFYLVLNFMIPFIFHSFVPKVQDHDYIFYIFPLFLMIASYGIYNLFEAEGKMILHSLEKINKKMRINFKTVTIGLICLLIVFLLTTRWFRNGIGLMFFKGGNTPALEHSEWREAASYLLDMFERGDVIITTLPLNMLYYFGNVDYQLDNGMIYSVHRYNKKNEDGFFLEPYAHTPVIQNLEQLRKVINSHSHGWLIMDKGRFRHPANVSEKIRKFVMDNLIPHECAGENTMVIYEWREG